MGGIRLTFLVSRIQENVRECRNQGGYFTVPKMLPHPDCWKFLDISGSPTTNYENDLYVASLFLRRGVG